jgi:hypothetical protein
MQNRPFAICVTAFSAACTGFWGMRFGIIGVGEKYFSEKISTGFLCGFYVSAGRSTIGTGGASWWISHFALGKLHMIDGDGMGLKSKQLPVITAPVRSEGGYCNFRKSSFAKSSRKLSES